MFRDIVSEVFTHGECEDSRLQRWYVCVAAGAVVASSQSTRSPLTQFAP